MEDKKTYTRDVGLMIVAGGMILVGITGLFFNLTFGVIMLFVGFGFLAMVFLTKIKTNKKAKSTE